MKCASSYTKHKINVCIPEFEINFISQIKKWQLYLVGLQEYHFKRGIFNLELCIFPNRIIKEKCYKLLP